MGPRIMGEVLARQSLLEKWERFIGQMGPCPECGQSWRQLPDGGAVVDHDPDCVALEDGDEYGDEYEWEALDAHGREVYVGDQVMYQGFRVTVREVFVRRLRLTGVWELVEAADVVKVEPEP